MQELNSILEIIDSNIGGSDWFVFLLLGTGLFFTIYLKFPQIRYFNHALKIVSGKYDKKDDEGDTSHFQALTTALSGTVGTGNIAGVALAIHVGGPAALFWMVVTAFLGMTTKFVEVTLSHKYREKMDDGTMAGGPMYYMKNADFSIFGNKIDLRWMAVLFAIATVISSFGTGSLPQINSISNSINAAFGLEHWITGLILSILLAFVIIGGIKRIAKVTEKLVPMMAIIYFIGCLLVLLQNYDNIIPSFGSIFSDLFTGSAATGGFLGAAIAFAFNKGVTRGLFSNEAGQGSAPIAHASARTKEPVSEGMVAILEPFIDTIIICTLTGITLLSSGVWKEKFENVFQQTDLSVMQGTYTEKNQADVPVLSEYIADMRDDLNYNGDLHIEEGVASDQITFIHARSVAEDVMVYTNGDSDISNNGALNPFTGTIPVVNGKLELNGDNGSLIVKGKSLVHSAPLTTIAFTRSLIGDWGRFIVPIGLLLFAFSTAISWSYYGDRAMTFLAGTKSIPYYRFVYVIGFFIASFVDTTIIWTFSGIAIAVMTIPNLVGILLLRKDMKQTVSKYWLHYDQDKKELDQ